MLFLKNYQRALAKQRKRNFLEGIVYQALNIHSKSFVFSLSQSPKDTSPIFMIKTIRLCQASLVRVFLLSNISDKRKPSKSTKITESATSPSRIKARTQEGSLKSNTGDARRSIRESQCGEKRSLHGEREKERRLLKIEPPCFDS